jgi:MerR family transcriptional regulator, light-induced transcriptional regulator
MRDSQHRGRDDRFVGGPAALARTVVSRLLDREARSLRPADEAVIAAIARALLDPDPDQLAALRQDLRRARIGDTELVDSYLPEVARHLGCAWAEDRAAFTDVTIGVARMQAMLREIGRDWSSNGTTDPAGATVLIVLPEGEQHSFGATLLAGQLRRQGISVRLEVGTGVVDLRRIVEAGSYDCAMISIACEEKLDHCRMVLDALKVGSGGRLWVAVGGPLLDRHVDVCRRTGADIATSDPLVALRGALAEPVLNKEVAG